jgi:hypothetical protein
MGWAEAAMQAAEAERDLVCLARFLAMRLVVLAILVAAAMSVSGCDAAINLALNAAGSTAWNAIAK